MKRIGGKRPPKGKEGWTKRESGPRKPRQHKGEDGWVKRASGTQKPKQQVDMTSTSKRRIKKKRQLVADDLMNPLEDAVPVPESLAARACS